MKPSLVEKACTHWPFRQVCNQRIKECQYCLIESFQINEKHSPLRKLVDRRDHRWGCADWLVRGWRTWRDSYCCCTRCSTRRPHDAGNDTWPGPVSSAPAHPPDRTEWAPQVCWSIACFHKWIRVELNWSLEARRDIPNDECLNRAVTVVPPMMVELMMSNTWGMQ